jgi:hypothetical protein
MGYGFIVVVRDGIVFACAEMDDYNHDELEEAMKVIYPDAKVFKSLSSWSNKAID